MTFNLRFYIFGSNFEAGVSCVFIVKVNLFFLILLCFSPILFAKSGLNFNGDLMVLAKSLPSGVSAVPTPVKLFDGSEPSFKTELTYPFYLLLEI